METAPAKQVQKRGAARERDAWCTEQKFLTLEIKTCTPLATQSILDNINSLPLVLYQQNHR